jgi:hypothetical protein
LLPARVQKPLIIPAKENRLKIVYVRNNTIRFVVAIIRPMEMLAQPGVPE